MIRGELVNLRAVERSDAPDLFRWLNDPEVMRYWGAPQTAVSSNEVQRWIEDWLDRETRYRRPACLVVETIEGDAIGFVILEESRAVQRSIALSLMIGERERWGEGLGSDTLQTVVDACFSTWNIHRIWLRCEEPNVRARRLYQRCGFVHEATLRDASFYDGEFHDVLIFGLLEPSECDVDR